MDTAGHRIAHEGSAREKSSEGFRDGNSQRLVSRDLVRRVIYMVFSESVTRVNSSTAKVRIISVKPTLITDILAERVVKCYARAEQIVLVVADKIYL